MHSFSNNQWRDNDKENAALSDRSDSSLDTRVLLRESNRSIRDSHGNHDNYQGEEQGGSAYFVVAERDTELRDGFDSQRTTDSLDTNVLLQHSPKLLRSNDYLTSHQSSSRTSAFSSSRLTKDRLEKHGFDVNSQESHEGSVQSDSVTSSSSNVASNSSPSFSSLYKSLLNEHLASEGLSSGNTNRSKYDQLDSNKSKQRSLIESGDKSCHQCHTQNSDHTDCINRVKVTFDHQADIVHSGYDHCDGKDSSTLVEDQEEDSEDVFDTSRANVGLRLASARSTASLDTNVLLQDSAVVAQALKKRSSHKFVKTSLNETNVRTQSPARSFKATDSNISEKNAIDPSVTSSFCNRSLDAWVESVQAVGNDFSDILQSAKTAESQHETANNSFDSRSPVNTWLQPNLAQRPNSSPAQLYSSYSTLPIPKTSTSCLKTSLLLSNINTLDSARSEDTGVSLGQQIVAKSRGRNGHVAKKMTAKTQPRQSMDRPRSSGSWRSTGKYGSTKQAHLDTAELFSKSSDGSCYRVKKSTDSGVQRLLKSKCHTLNEKKDIYEEEEEYLTITGNTLSVPSKAEHAPHDRPKHDHKASQHQANRQHGGGTPSDKSRLDKVKHGRSDRNGIEEEREDLNRSTNPDSRSLLQRSMRSSETELFENGGNGYNDDLSHYSEASCGGENLMYAIRKAADKIKLQTEQLLVLVHRKNLSTETLHRLSMNNIEDLSGDRDCNPQLKIILYNLQTIGTQLAGEAVVIRKELLSHSNVA